MKKIFQAIIWISALATIIGVGMQFKTISNEIELKLVSRDLLTRPIEVDGLKSSYKYNDKSIEKLWQLRYVLTNVGSSSIIGSGERSALIQEFITLNLTPGYEVLEVTSSSDDFNIKTVNKELKLQFMQWKPSEVVEVLMYLSQTEEVPHPSISINEREIIDGKVSNSSLVSNENKTSFIYELLPEPLVLFFKWFTIVTYGLIIFIMPFVIIDVIQKNRKFKRWLADFAQSVEHIITVHPDFPQDIKQWSNEHWKKSGLPMPKIPKDKASDTILGCVIIFFFLGIPLLFIVSI
ncbi:hypothetical protein Q9F25_003683 [Vibrio cholerae]